MYRQGKNPYFSVIGMGAYCGWPPQMTSLAVAGIVAFIHDAWRPRRADATAEPHPLAPHEEAVPEINDLAGPRQNADASDQTLSAIPSKKGVPNWTESSGEFRSGRSTLPSAGPRSLVLDSAVALRDCLRAARILAGRR